MQKVQYEGAVLDGRFAIAELAGHGGMSEVYRALDRQTMQEVAVKVLRTDRRVLPGRLAREARTLAALSHPAIARYVAHGTTEEGAPYVVLEWLEGEDLRQRIRRHPLAIDETLALGARLASALGAAHARGIVHRDLKPSNVFLEDCDVHRAKLFDFGLARWLVPRGVAASELTTADSILGTPGYMAPEQARGTRDEGPRADVFALGCLLFACLVGDSPFAGESAVAVLGKVLFEEAPRLCDVRPDAPPLLDAVVSRMLSKDPLARPEDGAAVAAELAAIDAPKSTRARAPLVARGSSLTDAEQRFVFVVLASPPPASRAAQAEVAAAAERAGARVEVLAGGVLCVMIEPGSAPAVAVSFARELRGFLPDAKIAVAAGRAEIHARVPVGEALDRAAALLEGAASGETREDDRTRRLVGEDRARPPLSGATPSLGAAVMGKATAFVGRDAELGAMRASYEECVRAPAARAVIVTGEPGIGKTRLVDELLRDVAAPSRGAPLVLFARADPLAFASAFAMLSRALREEVFVRGDEVAAQRARLLSRVSRAVGDEDAPRVADFLGELAGVRASPDRAELSAARLDPVEMGAQIQRAWEEFLAGELRTRPVIVVLEDLHWGDLPSVRLVDAALRTLADAPLFVVAAGRPEALDLFPRLFADRRVTHIRLGELSKGAAEALVRGALGEAAGGDAVAEAVARGGGNPFCLEEIVRAEAGGGGGGDLPASVLAIVEARIARETPEARRVLRAASVFGASFTAAGVAALMGGSERARAVRDEIERLVDKELVVRRRGGQSGAGEHAFVHALVREAAYATLTEGDRALGHKLAGEWLEARGEHDAAVLAEHFERGGEGARAVEQYRRAAEQALEGNDLRAASDWAARGVACGARGELRGALLLIEVEAQHFAGVIADARRAALEAAACCKRGSAVWARAVERIVATSTMLGEAEGAMRWVDDLCATWPEQPSELHLIAAARTLLPLLVGRKFVLAEALLSFVESAAGGARTPLVAAYLDRARSFWAMFHTKDLGAYRARAEDALASFERAGALRQACLQQGYVGYASILLGRYPAAVACLRDAVARSERMGLSNVAEAARHNLGYALARTKGGLAEARELEARAARAFDAMGDRRIAANSRAYLSEICALSGDAPAALRFAEEALATTSAPELRPLPLAALSRALLLSGREVEALAAAREGKALIDSLGGVEEGDAKLRLALVEALAAAGDRASARAEALAARDALLQQAANIGAEEDRRSFLEDVPENARTLLLARQL